MKRVAAQIGERTLTLWRWLGRLWCLENTSQPGRVWRVGNSDELFNHQK